MRNDDSIPPSAPRGGFVGKRQTQAADDIRAAQEAVNAALSVKLTPASPAAAAEGVVVHFAYVGDGYEIAGDVSRGAAGLAITRAEVVAPPPAGVTLRLLRSAPLGELLAAVRAHVVLEEARRRGTKAFLGEDAVPGVFHEGDSSIPETSGRTAMTDDLLRKVAIAYLQETGPGKDRRAIQRLAERFGRPEGTIRTWVGRARKEGWLGPGAKGRMGAEMGPKLRGWVGQTKRYYEPVEREATRIAEALGAKSAGQLMDALDAYDNATERGLADKLGVHPLAACVAAEILWGHSLTTELGERLDRAEAPQSEQAILDGLGSDLRAPFAGMGLTVTLDEPAAE